MLQLDIYILQASEEGDISSLMHLLIENPDKVQHLVSEHPVSFIQLNEFLIERCITVLDSDIKYLVKQIEDMTEINPLFLLLECYSPKCVLTRTLNPQYRKTFEDEFTKNVFCKQKKELSLVIVGSGLLFQEIRVLSRMGKDTVSSLHLHLIDKAYVPLALALTLFQMGNTFDVERCGNLLYKNIENVSIAALCLYFMQKCDPTYQAPSQCDFNREMWSQYLLLKQFTSFLRKNFPSTTININIYHHIDSFLLAMQNKKISVLPDAVFAVDILGKQNLTDQTAEEYKKLCNIVLFCNPKAYNLWLDRNNYKAYLLTVNVTGIDDSLIIEKNELE